MWHNKYSSIPYVEKGRTAAGADCWGLARLIYEQEYNIQLPSFSDNYESPDVERIAELLAQYREGWIQNTTPVAGDIVLFRILGHVSHIGVMISDTHFIHTRKKQNVIVARLDEPKWKNRIAGFYSYSEASKLQLEQVPTTFKTIHKSIIPGKNLGEILKSILEENKIPVDAKDKVIIFIDNVLISVIDNENFVPKQGQSVEYRLIPEDEKTLKVIAIVGLAFVTYGVASGMIGGAAMTGTAAALSTATGFTITSGMVAFGASMVVGMVGSMLINAIFPVRVPPAKDDPGSANSQFMLNGSRNEARPYSGIPIVLGQYRMVAPIAGNTYMFTKFDKSWLRMLLTWGIGPVKLEDFRIGTVPLANYGLISSETLTGINYSGSVYTEYTGTQEADLLSRIYQIYGKDTSQLAENTELLNNDISGINVIITANSNIISVPATLVPDITTGLVITILSGAVENYYLSGLSSPRIITGIDAVNNTITINTPYITSGDAVIRISNPDNDWEYFDITQLSNKVYLNLQFPEGLRGIYTKGDSAGDIFPVQFTGEAQITELNSGDLTVKNKDVNGDPIWTSGYMEDDTTNTELKIGLRTELTPYIPAKFLYRRERRFDSEDVYSDPIPATYSTSLYYKRKDSFVTQINFPTDTTPKLYRVRIRTTSRTGKRYQNEMDAMASAPRVFNRAVVVGVTGVNGTANAVNPPPNTKIALTALEIQASDSLSGSLDGINALVTSVCLDYDSATSSWIKRPTRNPASLFRYVLQHPANMQRISTADESTKLDLAAIAEWHAYCDSNNFMYDAILTDVKSILDVLRDICAAGRASPLLVSGKWSVTVDTTKPEIVQFFTPHNSWGFEATKKISVQPHALRVTFINSLKNYQSEDLYVYNDGYAEKDIVADPVNNITAKTAASIFEAIQLPGVTIPSTAKRQGKFHLAQAKLRPEVYTLNADMEYISCTRGDRVQVASDITMWGTATGRLQSKPYTEVPEVPLDNPIRTIYLEEPIDIPAGISYSITIRNSLGTHVIKQIPSTIENRLNVDKVIFSEDFAANTCEIGDLYMIGESSRQVADLIVVGIEPSSNLTARITLVDYAATLHTSEEAFENFVTGITLPATFARNFITNVPAVDKTSIRTDESVMEASGSSYIYKMEVPYVVTATTPATVFNPIITHIEGRLCLTKDISESWRLYKIEPLGSTIVFSDLIEGEDYSVQLRYISGTGYVGPWSTIVDDITITGRTNPPADVDRLSQGILVKPEGSNVRLTWPRNQEIDLKGYEVRSESSLTVLEETYNMWGLKGALYTGSDNSCIVSSATAGIPNIWYIKAYDTTNLYSLNPVEVYFTANKPSTPTGDGLNSAIKLSVSDTNLVIDWLDNVVGDTQFSILQYEIYNSANQLIWSGSSSIALVSLIGLTGTQTFTINARDLNGNLSDPAIITYNILPSYDIDSGQIEHTFGNSLTDASLTLSWKEVQTTFGVSSYEIVYDNIVTIAKTNTLVISPLPNNWLGTKSFTIKTIDKLGNKSNGITVVIDKIAPKKLVSLNTQIVDGTIMVLWTLPERTSLPVAYVHITKSYLSKTTGLLVTKDVGDKNGTFTTIFEREANTYTYTLTAVDTSGIQGEPSTFDVQVPQPPDYVFNGDFDSIFENKDNSLVTLDNAKKQDSFVYLPVDKDITYEQHFLNNNWSTPADQISAQYPIYIQPTLANSYYEEIIDFGQVFSSSQITASVTGNIVTGSVEVLILLDYSIDGVSWHDGMVATSVLQGQNFRFVKVRITANTLDVDKGIYRLEALNIRLDSKLKDDVGIMSCNSNSTYGDILDFTKDFALIKSATITPKASTSISAVYLYQELPVDATYSIVNNVCTVTTVIPHGFAYSNDVNNVERVRVNFISGAKIDTATYDVKSVINSTSYTIDITNSNTTGKLNTYSQSMRVFLFDNISNNRVSGDATWAVRGY